jgi:hypothetical protein
MPMPLTVFKRATIAVRTAARLTPSTGEIAHDGVDRWS